MSRRRWVLAGLASVVGGIMIGLLAVGVGEDRTAGGDRDAAAEGGAVQEGRGEPGSRDAPEPGKENVTTGGSAKSEVQVHPEDPAGTALPGLRTPPRKPYKPLISGPLPEEGTAKGRLVAGFPRDVVTLPPGATVIVSSVAPAQKSFQVAFKARVPMTTEALFTHYRQAWIPLGFEEGSVQTTDALVAASFRRGEDSFVVTAGPARGTRLTFTVFGTLHR